MPFPLSVTADRLPAVVARTTVAPPLVRLFPVASLSCTVMVDVLVPFAAIEGGAAVMVEVEAEANPGVSVTWLDGGVLEYPGDEKKRVRSPTAPVMVRFVKVACPEELVNAEVGLKTTDDPLARPTKISTPPGPTGLSKLSRNCTTTAEPNGTPL